MRNSGQGAATSCQASANRNALESNQEGTLCHRTMRRWGHVRKTEARCIVVLVTTFSFHVKYLATAHHMTRRGDETRTRDLLLPKQAPLPLGYTPVSDAKTWRAMSFAPRHCVTSAFAESYVASTVQFSRYRPVRGTICSRNASLGTNPIYHTFRISYIRFRTGARTRTWVASFGERHDCRFTTPACCWDLRSLLPFGFRPAHAQECP